MKPLPEFPFWRYHHDHEPRLIQSQDEYDKMPGKKEDWHDNPKDAGVKIETYFAGNHQKVRRVPGYVPGSDEISIAEGESQGEAFKPSEQDISMKSEAELREVLKSQGIPARQLKGKSKEKLLEMLG